MSVPENSHERIRVIKHTWVSMPDGVRLAARIWLPRGAEKDPVPALLEYTPYRKNDATAFADARRHSYFAMHGYASVRVDMRGSGDSEGILRDEYLPQEQEDACEVIQWLSQQPWCSGAVGMFGISWGGFAALQVAARKPKPLKAIITVCSSDDRYGNDCHYKGGCLLGSNMCAWASTMLAYNARPPDPDVVGEDWREMWLERLAQTPPFIETWLSHQTRDAYWKQGSVCEDYAAIQCPVFAVGGWADPYHNSVFRLLEHLSVPRKGLIGPWAHAYPERGLPGPAIGFLQECLRWWDHWLKGIDAGMMDKPMFRTWMQDAVDVNKDCFFRPGRWITESAWPSANIRSTPYSLTADHMLETGPLSGTLPASSLISIIGKQITGHCSGEWCPYHSSQMPWDQRDDDSLSVCFDSRPAKEPMEALGFPEAVLTLSVDRPQALLAVRLCDVAPSGSSLLVSWGLFNLSHRAGHEHPEPLEPGKRYIVRIQLDAIGHRLMTGHRWRLAISTTLWPHAWPSPEPVTMQVYLGSDSTLHIPVRRPNASDSNVPVFAEPEGGPEMIVKKIRDRSYSRSVHINPTTGLCERVAYVDYGKREFPDGLTYENILRDTYRIVEEDPISASVHCERTIALGRPRKSWNIRIEIESSMTADERHFYVTNILRAYEGGHSVIEKKQEKRMPRIFV